MDSDVRTAPATGPPAARGATTGMLRRDPVLLLILAAGLLQSGFYLSEAADTPVKIAALWVLTLPVDVVFGVLAWRVGAALPPGSPPRRFWFTLTAAVATSGMGDLHHAVAMIRDPRPEQVGGSPVQGVFFAAALSAMTLAMLRYPVQSQTAGERVRFWLEALTVLVGGAVLAWVFAVDPAAAPTDLVAVLGGAAIAMVALFAAVRLALSGSAPVTQLAAALLVTAMFLQILAVFVTPSGPGAELPTGVFLILASPTVLMAAGARIQQLQAQVNSAVTGSRPQKAYSALPYVAIATTFTALIFILPEGVNGRLWGVVVGALIITALVVTRQLLAFHDNVHLIKRLDAALLELRDQQKRLRHTADHDRLTMLLNRDGFGDTATEALRCDVPGTALLMIDLDDFKTINDTLGHTVGDALLVAVADRLRAEARPSDVVARLGGDEFAVLLREVAVGEADVLAHRILAALAHPMSVDGHRLLVHASIGGAIATDEDFVSLLRNADIALYEAKDRGKCSYVRYAADMKARLFETAELGARLRTAIQSNEFCLVYQPIVQLADGRIVGTEALIRWRRDGEVVPPDDFITAAERTGLIVPLGRWVLREACRQAAVWLRTFGDAAPLSMSVNVSGRQLREPDFVDDVAAALADAGLPPERLTIEMIETAVLDGGQINETLHRLRALGVRLALDDFGTAASSLGLLLTVPVTALKLDKSFVEDILTVPRQTAVANAVAQIAHGLSLDLVAEGIETPEQAELLQRLGYRHAQGFLFHRPLLPQEISLLWRPVTLPVPRGSGDAASYGHDRPVTAPVACRPADVA